MTRLGFTLGLAVLLGAAAGGAAQPGPKGPPPVVQFKQFGASPEQFWQSSVLRWTGQLTLDLEAVKGEVAGAKVGPLARAAINTQVENALLQTLELDRLVRKGGPKEKAYAAYAEVDKALAGVTAAVNQAPAAKGATAASLARLAGANYQLAAALAAGDTDPGRVKQRLVRLGEGLDDATEEVRHQCADVLPAERGLERALAASAREARLLARRARDGADPDLLRRTYAAMVERWNEAGEVLARARNLPPALGAQVATVEDLHRRAAGALGIAPPPPPPGVPGTPDAPRPGFRRLSFVVGADAGAQPRVTAFADEKGTVAYNFFAYDVGFDGGVRVDLADLNGDRIPDLVVAPGPSRNPVTLPVRVYDGRDLNLLVEFIPFPGWKGGLYAAGTDLGKDGRALLAVTAEGTQHIKLFDLAQGKEVDSFQANGARTTGGVRLAWGDANGDGIPDLFTTTGPGNAVTAVKVFSGRDRAILADFPVADNNYRGGAYITAGDVTGAGVANAVVGLDVGGPPLVRVFDLKGKALTEWLPFDERFRGGVRVALTARHHVVVGPGPGAKNSPARVFHTGNTKAPLAEIVPFVGFDGGLNVGGR